MILQRLAFLSDWNGCGGQLVRLFAEIMVELGIIPLFSNRVYARGCILTVGQDNHDKVVNVWHAIRVTPRTRSGEFNASRKHHQCVSRKISLLSDFRSACVSAAGRIACTSLAVRDIAFLRMIYTRMWRRCPIWIDLSWPEPIVFQLIREIGRNASWNNAILTRFSTAGDFGIEQCADASLFFANVSRANFISLKRSRAPVKFLRTNVAKAISKARLFGRSLEPRASGNSYKS